MKFIAQPVILSLSIPLCLALSACGDSGSGGMFGGSSGKDDVPPATNVSIVQMGGAASPANVPNLSQGPDVCFKAVAKHLGADAKVSEITSFFSVGKDIDGSDDKPAGEMTTCSVQYQSPSDPRKLVGTRLDLSTGQFAPPSPIEITVMGNAAEFKLEDYLIPLSSVNAAALPSVMEAQKARLGGVYGKYAWSGVRLSSPGSFSNVHTLRLDITGRLASNDIKENGYASVSIDGKRITADHLLP